MVSGPKLALVGGQRTFLAHSQVSDVNQNTHVEAAMADMTREEVDAKIGAAEARTDTKITRLEGKLDLVISKLDGVNSRIGDVRDDYRATRANQWVIGIGLAALIVACVFGAPTILGFGAQFRDIIHNEVESALSKK